jgi:hypothetical protein
MPVPLYLLISMHYLYIRFIITVVIEWPILLPEKSDQLSQQHLAIVRMGMMNATNPVPTLHQIIQDFLCIALLWVS